MSKKCSTKHLLRSLALFVVVPVAVGFGVTLALLDNRHFREAVLPSPAESAIPGPEALIVRRELLRIRDEAASNADIHAEAALNARLSQEAILRARAVYDAWMPHRNEDTKLFPQSLTRSQWNYRNTAADFFCFQLHTGIYTHAPDLDKLFETLEREASLNEPGALAVPRNSKSGRVLLFSSEHPRFGKRGPMFGTSEYIKDGLLSVYEGVGDPKVYERMIQLVDTVIARSDHQTRFGAIPSTDSEVNGEMLQTLARVARVESDSKYANMLGTIADAAIESMLPAYHGMPVPDFDYESDTPISRGVPLRDHGNEIIPGLAEAFHYAVDHAHLPVWQDRAARWSEPVAAMFLRCIERGRCDRGLLVNSFDAATGEIISRGPNDNWGYVLVGALIFADAAERQGSIDAERIDAIRAGVRDIAEAVARTDGEAWEGTSHDGYADTIESALYIASVDERSADQLLGWIDDQIGIMFAMQQPNGFVSEGYLDGNFMRTAIMYADMRSGGWTIEPWDPNAAVGIAVGDGRAVLHIAGEPGKTYRLEHRSMSRGFRGVYERGTTRLNAWPDWWSPSMVSSAYAADGTSQPIPREELLGGWSFQMPNDGTLRVELVLEASGGESL